MVDIVIEVDRLSKQYRLGQVGTGTVSHDLNRWWNRIRGKEDPYIKIGEANKQYLKKNNEYFWALRDINFEVKRGEILGIIGKNGAGKSTLLKILSRVTSPTTGGFKAKGRIASLLEVGTGFHPELTGRENIFLNGAILGMTKAEIKGKFDEIVAFSGVEKYIDTPVKRYSSGMYVRLAFAVAAHLEPEILIIDEVLAVGDAEFQKKCLGKMKDVANQGRTVIFVSHNMEAVSRLCTQALFIKDGQIINNGDVNKIISNYYAVDEQLIDTLNISERKDRRGIGKIRYQKLWFTDINNNIVHRFKSGDHVNIHAMVEPLDQNENGKKLYATASICNDRGQRLFSLGSGLLNKKAIIDGPTEIIWKIPKLQLSSDDYYGDLFLFETNGGQDMQDHIERAFKFIVDEGDFFNTGELQLKGRDMMFVDFKIESFKV